MLLLQVARKQVPLTEAGVAELALVRALARVQAHVRLHVTLLRKRLEAVLALERTLAGVGPVVAL